MDFRASTPSLTALCLCRAVLAVSYVTLPPLFHRARPKTASALVSHVVIYLMLYRKVRLLHPGRSCGTPRFSAPLAAKSFRPRSLRTRSCNFFVFCPFRTLPFSVHFFFHLNFLLSNGLRTLLQKHGGWGGFFPFRNYSPSHQSPATARQSRWPSPVPLRYDAVLHRHNL